MAENAPEDAPEKTRGSMSRRTFLKRAAGAAITMPFACWELKNQLVTAIKNPQTIQAVIDASVGTLRSLPERKENPSFRPLNELIKAGIDAYERETGRKAVFQRSPTYEQDRQAYNNKLEEIKGRILPPTDLEEFLTKSLSQEAQEVMSQSDIGLGNLGVSLATGSGFNSRFESYLRANPQLQSARFDIAKIEGKKYIDEAKIFIEEKVRKTGKPVSSSTLLVYFLKLDQGNITQGLFDTYIFLKFAARNSFVTGEGLAGEENNVKWFAKNIIDEYGSINYASNQEDGLNQIGKPYHSWNLVALLGYLPREFIILGGIYRQVLHLEQQGVQKLEADLLALKDLGETEKVLLKYIPKTER